MPSNILIKDNTAKIADFGFSKFEDIEEETKLQIGTPYYMAPETISE